MKGRRSVLLAGLLALALGGLVWLMVMPDRSELVYQGKRLRVWVGQCWDLKSSESAEKSKDIVRQIGTNAIPTLTGWLRAKDGPIKCKLMELTVRYPQIPFRPASAYEENMLACQGFFILGPIAKSAAPEVLEIWRQTNGHLAGVALRAIDPELAEKAGVPQLDY